jgi:hypothetical protein
MIIVRRVIAVPSVTRHCGTAALSLITMAQSAAAGEDWREGGL